MKQKEEIRRVVLRSGALLVVASLVLFVVIFYPVIVEEVRYIFLEKNNTVKEIVLGEKNDDEDDQAIFVASDFSIIIPKIGANAPIIENVDPYDEAEYRIKLKNGIAHAKNTKLPGEIGNTFLFAHSSDDFYIANKYNTVFYLLNKLEKNDDFFIVREGVIYKYYVDDMRKVDSENVEYLKATSKESAVTLMTCWPPGTAAKRLMVIGFLKEINKSGKIKIN